MAELIGQETAGAVIAEERNASQRFAIRKSHSRSQPWLVEDAASNPYEDAVLYLFTSRAKAEAFRQILLAERA